MTAALAVLIAAGLAVGWHAVTEHHAHLRAWRLVRPRTVSTGDRSSCMVALATAPVPAWHTDGSVALRARVRGGLPACPGSRARAWRARG